MMLEERMAAAIWAYNTPENALFIMRVTFEQTARMHAMLMTGAGRSFTEVEFAAFALQCAQRIVAGPTT